MYETLIKYFCVYTCLSFTKPTYRSIHIAEYIRDYPEEDPQMYVTSQWKTNVHICNHWVIPLLQHNTIQTQISTCIMSHTHIIISPSQIYQTINKLFNMWSLQIYYILSISMLPVAHIFQIKSFINNTSHTHINTWSPSPYIL